MFFFFFHFFHFFLIIVCLFVFVRLFVNKKALRAEVESSAATLVIRPVQPNPWPILRFMDFLWRAPATFLFTMYMGEDHCMRTTAVASEDNVTEGRGLTCDAG